MTAVDNKSDDDGNIALNARSLEFGSHFVFFKNSQAFYDRLEAELKRLDYEYWFGHVNYYKEKEFSGELTYFHKPDIFSWQKEFRLIVKHPENLHQDLVVKLGSLEDIADMVTIDVK